MNLRPERSFLIPLICGLVASALIAFSILGSREPRTGSSLVINWLFAFPLQQGLGIQAFFLGAKWDSSGPGPFCYLLPILIAY